jgi:hypothetical protein
MAQNFSGLARLIIALVGLSALAACGGGGGSLDTGTDPGNPGTPGGGGAQVTISGRVTFERLLFNETLGNGLNAANPVRSPAREVVVQAVSNNSVVASTATDADGNYSLSVPANRNMFIRVRAQMQKSGTPGWSFTVRDNTRSDAIYTLDGATFNSGTQDQARDLNASSGWGGIGYTATRAAAPFAILDTVYLAKELILGADPNAQFPELNLFWSRSNRDEVDGSGGSVFCPDDGAIITSSYFSGEIRDDCTGGLVPEGIYILGDYANGNGDTDEFDAHVIAHEFGHYFEDRFSRSDSFGGEHGPGDRLDLRVAFGEGWGNAFGAMALNDPVYRDSFAGIRQDGGFNLETGSAGDAVGWFSEASVGKILWDIFDSAADAGDDLSAGFKPIYDAMRSQQLIQTDALTSIYTFISALRAQSGVSSAAIAALLNRENIKGDDAFGRNESNNGGDDRALPVYDEIFLNTPKTGVCSSSVAGSKFDPLGPLNKLGNHRLLRFNNDVARIVTITAQGAAVTTGTVAATDPDIYVYRQGEAILVGESSDPGVETISQQQLPAGTYIIDVYDFDTLGTNQAPRCMTVSITGG